MKSYSYIMIFLWLFFAIVATILVSIFWKLLFFDKEGFMLNLFYRIMFLRNRISR